MGSGQSTHRPRLREGPQVERPDIVHLRNPPSHDIQHCTVAPSCCDSTPHKPGMPSSTSCQCQHLATNICAAKLQRKLQPCGQCSQALYARFLTGRNPTLWVIWNRKPKVREAKPHCSAIVPGFTPRCSSDSRADSRSCARPWLSCSERSFIDRHHKRSHDLEMM